jgi:hypothetical protein
MRESISLLCFFVSLKSSRQRFHVHVLSLCSLSSQSIIVIVKEGKDQWVGVAVGSLLFCDGIDWSLRSHYQLISFIHHPPSATISHSQ